MLYEIKSDRPYPPSPLGLDPAIMGSSVFFHFGRTLNAVLGGSTSGWGPCRHVPLHFIKLEMDAGGQRGGLVVGLLMFLTFTEEERMCSFKVGHILKSKTLRKNI